MYIDFNDSRLASLSCDQRLAARRWGKDVAKTLALRLQQLEAAETLDDLRSAPGRLHELKAARAGQLAADLRHGYRLVLTPFGSDLHKPDGGLDWQRVTAVLILEVVDYHD